MKLTDEWRKSTRSPNWDCVEVRVVDTVEVRDSKDPHGPVLKFDPALWREFCSRL